MEIAIIAADTKKELIKLMKNSLHFLFIFGTQFPVLRT